MANQTSLLRLLKLIALLKQEPPKSVKFIASFIEASERSAYRYIELLEEVGFKVQVTYTNKYFIEDNQWLAPNHYTKEELSYLKTLLLTSGQENKLSSSLLHKLNLNTDIDLSSEAIYNAKLSNFVERINLAIVQNQRVILKQYQSINTQNISDRIVEPIKFTAQFQRLCAFEVETQTNKYFNLERIGEVLVLKESQQFEYAHEFKKPDVFGFSAGKHNYIVHLQLNLKAKLLLTEEYPLTKAHITPLKNKSFVFKAEINNAKPIKRFYDGLKDDIEVLEENTIKF